MPVRKDYTSRKGYRKVIGGKLYYWYYWEPTKIEAEELAQRLRSEGRDVKVIPGKDVYGHGREGYNLYESRESRARKS